VATGSTASSAAAAVEKAKPKLPPPTPLCQAARTELGPRARCVETPLPELTTTAGTVTRVHDADDPIHPYVYALTKPSGEIAVGRGSGLTRGGLVDQILKAIDPQTTPPAVLARLYAELFVEAAVARCVDPGDKLPGCAPPTLDKDHILTVVIEEFPDPHLFNRDEHDLMKDRVEIRDGEFHDKDGNGAGDPDKSAPRPASFAPLPEMTVAPDWAAPPVAAAPADSDAICAAAKQRMGELTHAKCQAFGYPSLKLPNGELFYLANDGAARYAFAFRKTDGSIVAGGDLDSDSPLAPFIKAYDPAAVPPAALVAANLLVHPTPARIRCLGGDTIPGVTCHPPTAEMKPDGLEASAIIEELPIPDEHGMIADPAIRDYTWQFTPGGGFMGDGKRLVDLRDQP
jgi:hypothetical protein